MKITQKLVDRMVDHAYEDLPNECCGLVACKDGEAKDVIAMPNILPSGGSFEMHPVDIVDVFREITDAGMEVGAFYHSHPSIRPVPSSIDVKYAAGWPGVMWIIIGLDSWRHKIEDDWAEVYPDVWAWWIRNGRIYTAELEVVA